MQKVFFIFLSDYYIMFYQTVISAKDGACASRRALYAMFFYFYLQAITNETYA
jgi:hypothetical protein